MGLSPRLPLSSYKLQKQFPSKRGYFSTLFLRFWICNQTWVLVSSTWKNNRSVYQTVILYVSPVLHCGLESAGEMAGVMHTLIDWVVERDWKQQA